MMMMGGSGRESGDDEIGRTPEQPARPRGSGAGLAWGGGFTIFKIQDFVPASDLYFFEKTSVFRRRRFSENYKSSGREVPDSAYAELQTARATCPPLTYRFRIPAPGHIRKHTLPSDELVSPRR